MSSCKSNRIEVINSISGRCVAINGRRIAGEKPCGGGKVEFTWHLADLAEVEAIAVASQMTPIKVVLPPPYVRVMTLCMARVMQGKRAPRGIAEAIEILSYNPKYKTWHNDSGEPPIYPPSHWWPIAVPTSIL